MSGKIKVLQCVTSMNRGGLETVIMNYYRNIDRNKFDFDFLVQRNGRFDYSDEIEKLGGKIYSIPAFSPFKVKKYNMAMKRFFEKHADQYDIIHAHNNSFAMYILRAAKGCGFDVRIAHSHIAEVKFDPIRAPFIAYNKARLKDVCTARFACSNEAGKWLFGDDDFTIIKNAIDLEKFVFDKRKRKEYREKYDVSSRTILLGHIGRFEVQKNHLFLIKIMKVAKERGDDVKLMMIGEGRLESNIRRLVEEEGLGDSVVFVGNVGNPQDYLNAMDVFVFPSFFEGLGMVVIEAQANGLPCVVADTVVNECKVTPLVKFANLSNTSAGEWLKQIMKCGKNSRKNYYLELEKAGYDIEAAVKKLECKYEALVGDKVLMKEQN